MRINHNMSAVVANNKLLNNEDVVSQSMERLSSGLRINHAKDDPAGMAISNRMDTQINGIDQASRNAEDGTSLLETADGALNEITSIIQRMNELAVQAASDTNTSSDKDAIQSEISELKDEIDRMSRDTEFNTKTLLDGSLDQRVYSSKVDGAYSLKTDAVTRVSISDYVPAGQYKFSYNSATYSRVSNATASALVNSGTGTITEATAGTVSINGYTVELSVGDSYADALQKLQTAAEKGDTSMDISGTGMLTFTSTIAGSKGSVNVTCSTEGLKNLLGFTYLSTDGGAGTDAQVSIMNGDYRDGAGNLHESDFDQATWSSEGNKVTIKQSNGFSMSFMVTDNQNALTRPTDVNLDVTTMGSLTIQIGANEGQTMDVRIPEVTTASLYIDDLNVSTVDGASRALDSLQKALQTVTDIRSKLGAYENRMDYASSSLDAASENLTSALSRIKDIDMAEEMTTYTEYNVLVQASTSVLSQANDLPQQVLELLR